MQFCKWWIYCLLLFLGIQSATSLDAQNDLSRLSFEAPRLGTTIKCIAYVDADVDEVMIQSDFFLLLDSLNLIFSDYLPKSEVNRLSFSAGSQSWVSVSDPLFELLAHSTYISKLTDYRFDITMGSLTHLWRENTQKNKVPSKREIRKQLRNVGAQNIWLDSLNVKVQLSKKGMQLDFGGIAKGYMGDQLAGFLKRRQIQSFLIDMGGDLIAGDAPPGKEGWQIKVPYLDTILTVSNIAIATSGPDYQFFDFKGKRYTHILDPDTGWGISKPYSSTILAKEGYLADALASAFILMQTENCEEIGHIFPEMTYFLWKDDQIHQGNDHYHTE